ncbi:D-alanyl-D-alanine carboxypeptidase (penicillin-binding protein 5/6) [Evansella caseinilytica]|uniref:serine-type D-Ala-D-Ala carboxypeptidase n=1 Tax=Evansella caseinilytica TaxID=1503961 RepID=A0A1H3L5Z3_9BACI|nr:D-alanyl-D-alanine carboxypeptidase family protein [Evansella caseinilytica]SDY59801.1 D-alanyl-D-alanine carboxypeptidase (penicillin-binding protein 5/6) [Evansella caseinilytica]
MKKTFIVFLLGLYVFLSGLNVYAEEGKVVDLADQAKSAILIERDTGTVLYEKNSDEQLPPASMTKVMTMLLIMEALDSGKVKWDEKVRTSERAASMGGSQIFLEPGEEMTVEEMLKGIAIASANDASVAMAEHLAGSEEQFINMMNEKAKALGLENTHFVNSNGLPGENHYSSAADLAIMAKELLKYEEITKFTSLYEDYLRENTDDKFWLVNTNKLVKFYPGVDGLKTGYTSEAKYCLTASANKNGMRIIAVVMGAPTPKDRNRQITEMLDYAYSQYELQKRYERGELLGEIRVSKGEAATVPFLSEENVSLLMKKGESIEGITERLELEDPIAAPVKKGDPVGKLLVEKDGEILAETVVVAEENVTEASLWTLMKRTSSILVGKNVF